MTIEKVVQLLNNIIFPSGTFIVLIVLSFMSFAKDRNKLCGTIAGMLLAFAILVPNSQRIISFIIGPSGVGATLGPAVKDVTQEVAPKKPDLQSVRKVKKMQEGIHKLLGDLEKEQRKIGRLSLALEETRREKKKAEIQLAVLSGTREVENIRKKLQKDIKSFVTATPKEISFIEPLPRGKGILIGLMKIFISNSGPVQAGAKEVRFRWCINDGFNPITPPQELVKQQGRVEPYYELSAGKVMEISYGPHITPAAPEIYVSGEKKFRLKFYVTYKVPLLDKENTYFDYFSAELDRSLKFFIEKEKDEGIFKGQDLFKEVCVKK